MLLSSILSLTAQAEKTVSQKALLGIAEFRKDILTRQQAHLTQVRSILERIDTSNIPQETKDLLLLFIRTDFAKKAPSNSTQSYNELPAKSPLRSPLIEEYVRNNEDYSIDKGLIAELKADSLFKEESLKIADITPLIQELEFIDIRKNDRILHAHAANGLLDMLMGYIYDDIEITVHNKYTDLHYTALDRMDRYPNVNNGNVIEFLNIYETAIKLDGEQWDKIIIRDAFLFENELNPVLKSVHNNLTSNGRVFVKAEVRSSDKCKSGSKKEKLIKGFLRLEYEVLKSLDLKCETIFELKIPSKNFQISSAKTTSRLVFPNIGTN